MNLLIRADSSSTIGLGHIMRDIVLASQYPQDTITFACQDLEGSIIDKIPYPVHILNSNEPEELINIIRALNINRIIFDHYDIDYDFEKKIKQETGIIIVSLDDTYEQHYCDILINHNICANEAHYRNLVPSHCIIRCGKDFTLIRDEFKDEKIIKRDKIFDIFIAMGGTDPTNTTLPILRMLGDNYQICVITTSSNPHLIELKKYFAHSGNIHLCVDSNEIAKLLQQSRLAIITPSVIVHEVLFMEIPFIAIKTANNQDDMYNYLYKNGYSVFNKFDDDLLKKTIIKLIQ